MDHRSSPLDLLPSHLPLRWLCACVLAVATLSGAAPAKRQFDLPADNADRSLRRFSAQAGLEVVFASEVPGGVRTNEVRGEYAPAEAVRMLLAGTGLTATQDPASGAFMVNRANEPNGETVAPRENRSRGSNGGGKPPAPAPGSHDEERILLTPFEVLADSDRSYGALNSNAITRFNAELTTLPISADILTEAFMNDVGATSVEDLVQQYSAGAGAETPNPSENAGGTQPGDRVPGSTLTLRGLIAAAVRRDGFMEVGGLGNPGSSGAGFSSTFNLERAEVILGPQSLLYGANGGGGVVNAVSKRARLARPAFGSARFKLDQYGNTSQQYDFGVGSRNAALRLAAVEEQVGGRRENLGGNLRGYYLQFAFRPHASTVLRLTGEQTMLDRRNNYNGTVSAGGVARDGRDGQTLHYLLASNQVLASAKGSSDAGAILNGHLNWNNVDSLAGWFRASKYTNKLALLSAESRWNSWLSTEFAAGYNTNEEQFINHGLTFLTPNNPSNPLKTWAMSTNSRFYQLQPTRRKAFRFSAMAEHALFGLKAQGRTMFGGDLSRATERTQTYGFFATDASGAVIRNANGTPTTIAPLQYWSVENGPVKDPLFNPFTTDRYVLNGVTYARALGNPAVPALVSPDNPLGVVLGGTVNQLITSDADGLYAVNQMDWFEGRLTTLAGARWDKSVLIRLSQAANGPVRESRADTTNFNFGINYRWRDWLRPYVGVSSAFAPPISLGQDPYGEPTATAHATGGEIGLKLQNAAATLSGSLAYFDITVDEGRARFPSQLTPAINPTGLNGVYNGAAGNGLTVDYRSRGVQTAITYSPGRNWRARFSAAWTDGTIKTSKSYAQLYNDQFYQNAQGQVTFQNGTVVYVPAVYTAARPTVPPGTAGATPLTVTMMSTPGNSYYANPTAVSGAINLSSNAAKILTLVDPVNGPILTGRTGLPISDLQIKPGFTPPGTIPVARAGDRTSGYPEYSANFTSVYTIGSGWLKGVRLGGTASVSTETLLYYYYPDGVTTENNRVLFKLPSQQQFNLILGYERRFKRFSFTTQMNVANLFNHYQIVVQPHATNSFSTGPNQAIFVQQPRSAVWSASVSF